MAKVNQAELPGWPVMGGKSQELVYDRPPHCWTFSRRLPSVWKNRSERAKTVGRSVQPIGCQYPAWQFTQSNIIIHQRFDNQLQTSASYGVTTRKQCKTLGQFPTLCHLLVNSQQAVKFPDISRVFPVFPDKRSLCS